MDAAQFDVNVAMEERHWWFTARREIMRRINRGEAPDAGRFRYKKETLRMRAYVAPTTLFSTHAMNRVHRDAARARRRAVVA